MRRFLLFCLVVFFQNTIWQTNDSLAVAQEQSQTQSNAGMENLWTRESLDWQSESDSKSNLDSDWPSFLGPNHNGKSDERGVRFNWTEESPAVVWTREIGEGYGASVLSAGRLFHFDRDRDEARLVALNAETGELLWEFKYATDYVDTYGFDGGPRSSPIVDEDRVYIHGVEGMLHCLNANSGDTIWMHDTNEKFGVVQNFFGVGSSPCIHNDLLIVMVGGSPESSQQIALGKLDQVEPNNSGIVAFDKLTGEVRYQTINDLASYSTPLVTKIGERTIGLAFCRSGLFAFDPDTGESIWNYPYRARKFESVNASTPVVVDSRVLLAESYGPGAILLDVSDGVPNMVWTDADRRDKALACHWNTPVVVDGFAYASSGEKQSTALLQCVELATGDVQWSQPGLTRSSLTYVDGHLICVCESGKLLALKCDPESYQVVAEVDRSHLRLLAPCWASSVVAHGYLYVRDKNRLVCLDIQK